MWDHAGRFAANKLQCGTGAVGRFAASPSPLKRSKSGLGCWDVKMFPTCISENRFGNIFVWFLVNLKIRPLFGRIQVGIGCPQMLKSGKMT
jgi:hypothetical protein